MGVVIAIVSGKGGTGKTSLTAGIASCFAVSGKRVLCIDMDVGLRNLDLSLGMSDRVLMDFSDVLSGRSDLSHAVVSHPRLRGLDLLTAPVHYDSYSNDRKAFLELLRQARSSYDYVLLDAPAGIGEGFQLATCGADRALVVCTSDPSSLRDAQRAVSEMHSVPTVHLVVNRVQIKLLKKVGATIDDAMDNAGLPLLGVVPEDPNVGIAAYQNTPLILISQKRAAIAYMNIAKRLTGEHVPIMRIRR